MSRYIDPVTGLNNIDLILEDARVKKGEDLGWDDYDEDWDEGDDEHP